MSPEERAWFSQSPYRCRLEWGRRGARAAAGRGDILVIVDTLTFSTAVATAIDHGGVVFPCGREDDPGALALHAGGEVAVHRAEVPARGRFSLSPLTYLDMEPGTRVILPSPNGAACSRAGRDVPALFVAALVNAGAVAAAVSREMAASGGCVTVLACGERWQSSSEDGELRVAVEDYLGAGAVLSRIPEAKSPEARVCEGAFLQARGDLEALLLECGSGRELRERGFEGDVRHAAHLDAYGSVPVMRGERIERQ